MMKTFNLQEHRNSIQIKFQTLKKRLGALAMRGISLSGHPFKPLIFLGPSLNSAEAAKLIDADFQPPIGRGDLLRAVEEGYRFIGIIDGVFHQRLAVSLQEIRYAIEQGAVLYGSSSMGALRAAEAYPLGMIGIGEIYSWYRTEKIDSDDEVALSFDPLTGKPLTEPLVNIRATLKKAFEKGLIDEVLAQSLLAQAIRLPFTERTYANLLSTFKGQWSEEKIKFLRKYFSERAVDLKAHDAKTLLLRIRGDYDVFSESKA